MKLTIELSEEETAMLDVLTRDFNQWGQAQGDKAEQDGKDILARAYRRTMTVERYAEAILATTINREWKDLQKKMKGGTIHEKSDP